MTINTTDGMDALFLEMLMERYDMRPSVAKKFLNDMDAYIRQHEDFDPAFPIRYVSMKSDGIEIHNGVTGETKKIL